jgi:hypothetical protein
MRDAEMIMDQAMPRDRWRRSDRPAVDDPLAWWCLTEILVAYGTGKKS